MEYTFFQKFLFVLAITLFVSGIVVWIVMLQLGYFPSWGEKLGFGQSQDLGVVYTDADYTSGKDKLAEASEDGIFETTFTEAELTALVNACPGSACVVHDAQVKILPDQSLALSGTFDRDDAVELLLNTIPEDDQADVEQAMRFLPAEPAVYLEASVVGQEDTVIINVQKIKIAGIGLPSEALVEISNEITEAWNDYFMETEGTQLTEFTVTSEGVLVHANFSEIDLDTVSGLSP